MSPRTPPQGFGEEFFHGAGKEVPVLQDKIGKAHLQEHQESAEPEALGSCEGRDEKVVSPLMTDQLVLAQYWHTSI